jgi:DNA-directed RNA polymerase subunit M/transcription elongation factor TFIIS
MITNNRPIKVNDAAVQAVHDELDRAVATINAAMRAWWPSTVTCPDCGQRRTVQQLFTGDALKTEDIFVCRRCGKWWK